MGVWFGLQGMLISAGNASKLLWGSKDEDDRIRRQPLRDSVTVDDKSPFYKRQIRNDFEHFDERLERWFEKDATRNYFGRNIGDLRASVSIGGKPPHRKQEFGTYNPETATVSFWTRSVELNPLIAEAERVLQILERH